MSQEREIPVASEPPSLAPPPNTSANAPPKQKKKDSFLFEFLDMKGITLGGSKLESVTSGASRTIKIPRIEQHNLQILPPDYKIYDKYKNMLRIGLEEGQIRHKMLQDGLDPDGLFNNPIPTRASVRKGKKRKVVKNGKVKRSSKVVESFAPNAAIYNRYVKMLEVGMQEGPVLHRVVYDGLDPEGFICSEAYQKYLEKEQEQVMNQKLEILKLALPKIKARPQKADFTGVHSILGEFFAKKLEEQGSQADTETLARKVFVVPKRDLTTFEPDDEVYSKYTKMFSVGLKEPQVFHKLISDGLAPEGFMNSITYQNYLQDQQNELMQQKLDLLKRFLPKMQQLENPEDARKVSKSEFAEVQKTLNSFLSENLLKRQAMIEKNMKADEHKFTPPPVELQMLDATNPLWNKYAKMLIIGLKEGAVLHKIVYDGLDPAGFLKSLVYKTYQKEKQKRLMKQKLRILDIFLPKAKDEPSRGDFDQVHQTLAQIFEKKKKKSSERSKLKAKSFKTMKPKKLRALHPEDPSFENYVRMLKIGLADTQVIHKLVYDGIEPESFLDSTIYREHLLEQKRQAKLKKLELLRQFIPTIQYEDDDEEDDEEEDEEEEEKKLKSQFEELEGKLGNVFGGFSLY